MSRPRLLFRGGGPTRRASEWRSPAISPVGECRPDGSGEYQIRHHFLAPRLWAEEKGEAPTAAADNAADQLRASEDQLARVFPAPVLLFFRPPVALAGRGDD
jgi:hypothetical protein